MKKAKKAQTKKAHAVQKLAIVTGTSRGLGECIARHFLGSGYKVVGLARKNGIRHPNFYFLKIDLAADQKMTTKLQNFIKKKRISFVQDRIVLVNNAATILPIHYFQNSEESEISQSIQLNLQAPIRLTHFVVQKCLPQAKQVTICNVSSGAALRPMLNWSMYCATKSGLKMFTDCLQLDSGKRPQLKAFSFYPGVMDTKMQATIRQQKSENFKNVQHFKDLKNKNNLLDPDLVARKLFGLIENPQKIKKAEYDVNELEGDI